MSSSSTPTDSTVSLPTSNLNDRHDSRPSVAVMKDVIDYAPEEEIQSVEAVAKYVAIQHPKFDLFPALPAQFHVEFDGQTMEETRDGDVRVISDFEVSIGDQHLRRLLGTVSVKRTYATLSDARTNLGVDKAIDATVGYAEPPTP